MQALQSENTTRPIIFCVGYIVGNITFDLSTILFIGQYTKVNIPSQKRRLKNTMVSRTRRHKLAERAFVCLITRAVAIAYNSMTRYETLRLAICGWFIENSVNILASDLSRR